MDGVIWCIWCVVVCWVLVGVRVDWFWVVIVFCRESRFFWFGCWLVCVWLLFSFCLCWGLGLRGFCDEVWDCVCGCFVVFSLVVVLVIWICNRCGRDVLIYSCKVCLVLVFLLVGFFWGFCVFFWFGWMYFGNGYCYFWILYRFCC